MHLCILYIKIIQYLLPLLPHHLPHPFLTLHDQVNLGGLGLMLCLNGASIGALIIDIHLLDSKAVFQRMAFL